MAWGPSPVAPELTVPAARMPVPRPHTPGAHHHVWHTSTRGPPSHRLGLPVDLGAQPLAQAVDLIGHDKKRAGSRLRFIVARAPGDVGFADIDVQELRSHVTALVG